MTMDASTDDRARPDLVERFLLDPDHARALDLAAAYLNSVFDRPSELLGVSVGVTVHPSDKDRVLIRVNGGIRVLADIQRSGSLVTNLLVTTADGGGDLESVRRRAAARIEDGFDASPTPNVTLAIPGIEPAFGVLADPLASARCRAFAKDNDRRLFNAGYHNAALEPLIGPLLKA